MMPLCEYTGGQRKASVQALGATLPTDGIPWYDISQVTSVILTGLSYIIVLTVPPNRIIERGNWK